jgi:sterol desaturase/sphingolipid hydroxylase (fatty acid hydroxylase superfamily)
MKFLKKKNEDTPSLGETFWGQLAATPSPLVVALAATKYGFWVGQTSPIDCGVVRPPLSYLFIYFLKIFLFYLTHIWKHFTQFFFFFFFFLHVYTKGRGGADMSKKKKKKGRK